MHIFKVEKEKEGALGTVDTFRWWTNILISIQCRGERVRNLENGTMFVSVLTRLDWTLVAALGEKERNTTTETEMNEKYLKFLNDFLIETIGTHGTSSQTHKAKIFVKSLWGQSQRSW